MEFEGISKEKEGKESMYKHVELPEEISRELLSVLQRKLVEYKDRIEKEGENIRYAALELLADTNYKIKVLSRLLLEGYVDFDDVARDTKEKDGVVFESTLRNALAVIEDYVKTGGKSVVGGTGF